MTRDAAVQLRPALMRGRARLQRNGDYCCGESKVQQDEGFAARPTRLNLGSRGQERQWRRRTRNAEWSSEVSNCDYRLRDQESVRSGSGSGQGQRRRGAAGPLPLYLETRGAVDRLQHLVGTQR